jgi:hypothetical protein
MELRGRYDLIKLMEYQRYYRSLAELDELKRKARSRPRPKWLNSDDDYKYYENDEDDFDIEYVDHLQKIYGNQVPAIRADIDDLFKLLSEIVDLRKSVYSKFHGQFNHNVLAAFIALVYLESNMSLETIESSAPSIFDAVESLDDAVEWLGDSSTTHIKVFIEMMRPTKEAEFKFDNGKVLLQNASSFMVKFPARSLLGIGHWITKSDARELVKIEHESEGSNLTQASKIEPVILNQEEVAGPMNKIYMSMSKKRLGEQISTGHPDTETEIWISDSEESVHGHVGNKSSDDGSDESIDESSDESGILSIP